jgi:Fe-S-cluster containining protein
MEDLLTPEEKTSLCMKCFYCCKSLYIPIDAGLGWIEFLRQIRGVEIKFHNMTPFAVVECPCVHLTKKGCSIYDKRPVDCAMFDGRRDMFHPEKCLWTQAEKEKRDAKC